jgi:hypothetical protein
MLAAALGPVTTGGDNLEVFLRNVAAPSLIASFVVVGGTFALLGAIGKYLRRAL